MATPSSPKPRGVPARLSPKPLRTRERELGRTRGVPGRAPGGIYTSLRLFAATLPKIADAARLLAPAIDD